MSWLTTLIPSPDDRNPLTFSSFSADFLPVLFCYYATAVMVLIPNTFRMRLAFLPLTLWSAFRAATSIDIALAFNSPGLAYLNYGLCILMVTTCMRAIEWTFCMKPFVRVELGSHSRQKLSPKVGHGSHSGDLGRTLWNAFELLFNLRGHGWNWSGGLQLPPETRRVGSTPAFIFAVLASLVENTLVLDASLYIIQSFSPSTFGSPVGGTIYDSSLPLIYRYARSSFISLLSGLVVHCAIQVGYDVFTVIGIILFRQYPAQWPPIFNEPWRSTSLSEFWAKRWHQVFRRSFISVGGNPLYFLIGRPGSVMGVFFASGLLHDLGMWGMGRGTEFWSVAGFFLVMGVGVVMEGVWKNVFGRKIGGWTGWTWTMLWGIGWSHILVDAWLRRGLAGSIFMPESSRPSKIFVDYLYRLLRN